MYGATDPDGQIVRICKRLLERLPLGDGEPPAGSLGDAGGAGDAVAAIGAGERCGELHGVPSLPIGFIARDELEGLRDAVLRGLDGAIGVTGRRLGLHGQGGIGKTVLAAALARDDSVRRHFPDGVFWVTVGERPDLVARQIELLERVGVARGDLRSAREGLRLLRDALAERQCLLIVDDGSLMQRVRSRLGTELDRHANICSCPCWPSTACFECFGRTKRPARRLIC